ncbi:MAG: hypothetical protein COA43_01825 [Robiginitomaculum sp.]|nr:MAG: hypothetical protein COA43_01825 [Robiginitomaculum sp.]
MKHHLMIALGLILAIIFIIRGAEAFAQPGLGIRELYVLGGFIFSGILLWKGFRDWREAKNTKR